MRRRLGCGDTPDHGKVELTPKNLHKQLFKFYKEHFYPIAPPPSFRHIAMWALQSGQFILNWQFSFGK